MLKIEELTNGNILFGNFIIISDEIIYPMCLYVLINNFIIYQWFAVEISLLQIEFRVVGI